MALRLTGTVQVAAVTGTPILNKLERSRDSGTQGHGPNRCAAGSTPSLPGPGSDKEPQCIESSEPPAAARLQVEADSLAGPARQADSRKRGNLRRHRECCHSLHWHLLGGCRWGPASLGWRSPQSQAFTFGLTRRTAVPRTARSIVRRSRERRGRAPLKVFVQPLSSERRRRVAACGPVLTEPGSARDGASLPGNGLRGGSRKRRRPRRARRCTTPPRDGSDEAGGGGKPGIGG